MAAGDEACVAPVSGARRVHGHQPVVVSDAWLQMRQMSGRDDWSGARSCAQIPGTRAVGDRRAVLPVIGGWQPVRIHPAQHPGRGVRNARQRAVVTRPRHDRNAGCTEVGERVLRIEAVAADRNLVRSRVDGRGPRGPLTAVGGAGWPPPLGTLVRKLLAHVALPLDSSVGRPRSANSSAKPNEESTLPISSRSERSACSPPKSPRASPSERPSSAARSS